MSNMEQIRQRGYPLAKRGAKVRTQHGIGYITSANECGHILVRISRQKRPIPFHPGDVEYVAGYEDFIG